MSKSELPSVPSEWETDPYWSTLYRGVPFAKCFAELDEWAKEEAAHAAKKPDGEAAK